MGLDKAKRNALFTTITNKGLDPRAFKLIEHPLEAPQDHLRSRIGVEHPATDSVFLIDTDTAGLFAADVRVGEGDFEGTDFMPWAELLSSFAQWLDEVELDRKTPDLWAELRPDLWAESPETREVLVVEFKANEPFNADERRR
jgi:hypothetical protein